MHHHYDHLYRLGIYLIGVHETHPHGLIANESHYWVAARPAWAVAVSLQPFVPSLLPVNQVVQRDDDENQMVLYRSNPDEDRHLCCLSETSNRLSHCSKEKTNKKRMKTSLLYWLQTGLEFLATLN